MGVSADKPTFDEDLLRKALRGRLGNLLLGDVFVGDVAVELPPLSIALLWLTFSLPAWVFPGETDREVVSHGLVKLDNEFDTGRTLRSCLAGLEISPISFPEVASLLLLSDIVNFEIAILGLDSELSGPSLNLFPLEASVL